MIMSLTSELIDVKRGRVGVLTLVFRRRGDEGAEELIKLDLVTLGFQCVPLICGSLWHLPDRNPLKKERLIWLAGAGPPLCLLLLK